MADVLATGLKEENFSVDVANRGDEGLWRAREFTYSAIILDLLLPGLNGFIVCRELRREGITTPILVLTAKDGELDQAEVLDTGADDFLSKPFSFVVLVARLRALLRRSASAAGAVLGAGSLVLDLATLSCRRGDVVVRLTPREFALAAALVRRQGTVVSRTELLDEVWGPDSLVDRNVLDVYIGYLRRKLDHPFGVRSIRTVRSCGFMIVPVA